MDREGTSRERGGAALLIVRKCRWCALTVSWTDRREMFAACKVLWAHAHARHGHELSVADFPK